ncbi:DegT/DnrJ/EryC1/StrS family aminotransferase [Cyanobium sp. HWJ4-Hawea]|uniref:DegT/DnrJ/EryC1/StrS family aminotransferase n=1 Tax=Cyanobium sp. HWJ4-Hawea TaxID=2823713 RepID=UPI0020CEC09F|nr:DegT/DnrJ/EryC1/StrS family aminotransferase [Cyanobium sp. HWJ4-Hawea]MCP9809121.1 DegT/DnrJ/EryC1/StrS family aminotransferase [Cyanobium sp. HWJ4-Hawea]
MKRRLPTSSELIGYLGKLDASSQYTNFGVLHQELQKYIASRYHALSSQVALASSATLALSLCIKYYQLKAPTKKDFFVVMPSWTFAATAHSALFIGCRVVFVDTSKDGLLEPLYVRELIQNNIIKGADLILPVIPFGRSYESKEWEDFSGETGIPVVIDCAAGFSSARLSRIPTIVSTHATKYFPTGEGGFILCAQEKLIAYIRSASNFGFAGSRTSNHIGTNAKLSEYHAAIGLAYRDVMLSKSSIHYRAQVNEYLECLSKSCLAPFGNSLDLPVSTFNIQLPEVVEDNTIEFISGIMVTRFGIEARRWWHSPLHRQAAFTHCHIAGGLENTTTLARSVIGVPLGDHVEISLIKYIVESLLYAYEHSLAMVG